MKKKWAIKLKEITMKRFALMVLFAAILATGGLARAEQPAFTLVAGLPNSPLTGCATAPQMGTMPFCVDAGTDNWYYWNGTAYALFPLSAASIVLNGSTSGAVTLQAAATTTSYTFSFPSAAGAQGSLLRFINGTGATGSLADVATGSVLISGGVGAAPSYGAVPSAALTTASATAGFYHHVYTNGEAATNSTSVADYWPLQGMLAPQVVAAIGDAESIMPVVTYKKLSCTLVAANGTVTAPGSGASYAIAVDDVTQTNTSVTCTITGASATTCADNTDSFTTTAGDLVAMISTPSTTPTALEAKCSLEVDY